MYTNSFFIDILKSYVDGMNISRKYVDIIQLYKHMNFKGEKEVVLSEYVIFYVLLKNSKLNFINSTRHNSLILMYIIKYHSRIIGIQCFICFRHLRFLVSIKWSITMNISRFTCTYIIFLNTIKRLVKTDICCSFFALFRKKHMFS